MATAAWEARGWAWATWACNASGRNARGRGSGRSEPLSFPPREMPDEVKACSPRRLHDVLRNENVRPIVTDPPDRRSTGAPDVSSASQAKQEEAATHGQGEEDDQAAEEARKRSSAVHQAVAARRRRRQGTLATANSPPLPPRAARSSRRACGSGSRRAHGTASGNAKPSLPRARVRVAPAYAGVQRVRHLDATDRPSPASIARASCGSGRKSRPSARSYGPAATGYLTAIALPAVLHEARDRQAVPVCAMRLRARTRTSTTCAARSSARRTKSDGCPMPSKATWTSRSSSPDSGALRRTVMS
jgi:hypothetical protein